MISNHLTFPTPPPHGDQSDLDNAWFVQIFAYIGAGCIVHFLQSIYKAFGNFVEAFKALFSTGLARLSTDLNRSAGCHFKQAASQLQQYLKCVENLFKPANCSFNLPI